MTEQWSLWCIDVLAGNISFHNSVMELNELSFKRADKTAHRLKLLEQKNRCETVWAVVIVMCYYTNHFNTPSHPQIE